jgi:hypothetical protein
LAITAPERTADAKNTREYRMITPDNRFEMLMKNILILKDFDGLILLSND